MDRDEAQAEVERAVARGDFSAAETVVAENWRAWSTVGDIDGGRSLFASVLDRAAAVPTRDRALALYGDGVMAFRQGDQAASLARNEEALDVARVIGDAGAESLALVGLSRVAFRDGRFADVVELAREARVLAGGDPRGEVWPMHMQAAGTRLSGDYDAARDLYVECLELNRSLGNDGVEAMELHNLAHVELHRGDVAAAEGFLALWRERKANSSDPYDRAMWALNEAALAAAHGERHRAAARLDLAERRLAGAGIVLDPDDAFELEYLRAQLA